MPPVLFLKLLAIFTTIGIGWAAGRTRAFSGGEAARILSNAAFFVFAPALLFRATARIDLETLPWHALLAFFVPVVLWMLAVYGWQLRRTARPTEGGAGTAAKPAEEQSGTAAKPAEDHSGIAAKPAEDHSGTAAKPAVRAITAAFGNNAQLGIPMAIALFGETGLQIHLAVVSLHALTLLTILTLLVERDLAAAQAQSSGHRPPLWHTLARVVRNTVIHPIVLPVLAGLAWNVTGLPIPGPLDEVLVMLGTAVVPLCLVAIGLSLGHYGLKGAAGGAATLAAGKLLVQPALVLAAGLLLGLPALPLAVIVMAAANPTGVNALMFAQRYRSQEGEATAAIVLSTLAFVATAPLWLLLLQFFTTT